MKRLHPGVPLRSICGVGLLFLSLLSGCAFTPGGKMEEAIKSHKGVIISPVFSLGGVLWERVGTPDQTFLLTDAAQAKDKIGAVYQMVVVEPGTYRVTAATAYAGPGRADPKGLTAQAVTGAVGRLKMFNRSYSEPYVAKVWKDRVVQRVDVPGSSFCASMGPYGDCSRWVVNPSTSYDQVVQAEGWYDEKRFRPAINVVDFMMEFQAQTAPATLEVQPGEVLLINSLRVLARDADFDYQRCTSLGGDKSYSCPLNGVRAELGHINLDFFREQAATGGIRKLDANLLTRVRPYALKPSGKVVGQSNDQLPLYDIRGNGIQRRAAPG